MDKNPSRVAQEAKEAARRSAEVEKKIDKLSDQLANPDKHFSRRDERTQSAVERFRRYFSVDHTKERRKPTRSEMRAQRTRALVWACIAIFLLFVVGRRIIMLLLH
jgi:hypothetical protein